MKSRSKKDKLDYIMMTKLHRKVDTESKYFQFSSKRQIFPMYEGLLEISKKVILQSNKNGQRTDGLGKRSKGKRSCDDKRELELH